MASETLYPYICSTCPVRWLCPKGFLKLPDHIQLTLEVRSQDLHKLVLCQSVVVDLSAEPDAVQLSTSWLHLKVRVLEEQCIPHIPDELLPILPGHGLEGLLVNLSQPDGAQDHYHVVAVVGLNYVHVPPGTRGKLGCQMKIQILVVDLVFVQSFLRKPAHYLLARLLDLFRHHSLLLLLLL